MNKQTIITILLALVATAGQGQVNYHIDGNTGHSITRLTAIRGIPISQERFTFTIIHHSWIPFRS